MSSSQFYRSRNTESVVETNGVTKESTQHRTWNRGKHSTLAVNMELAMRNQHQLQGHKKTLVPTSVNAKQNQSKPAFQSGLLQTSCDPRQGSRPPSFYCPNCGVVWVPVAEKHAIIKNLWTILLKSSEDKTKQGTTQIKRKNHSTP